MMSSLQTCSFIFPVPKVKLTPVASTVNAVLVGVGVVQVKVAPPLPPWPPAPALLPAAPAVPGLPALPALLVPAPAPAPAPAPFPPPAVGGFPALAPCPE